MVKILMIFIKFMKFKNRM